MRLGNGGPGDACNLHTNRARIRRLYGTCRPKYYTSNWEQYRKLHPKLHVMSVTSWLLLYTAMVAYESAALSTPGWKPSDLADCRIGHKNFCILVVTPIGSLYSQLFGTLPTPRYTQLNSPVKQTFSQGMSVYGVTKILMPVNIPACPLSTPIQKWLEKRDLHPQLTIINRRCY